MAAVVQFDGENSLIIVNANTVTAANVSVVNIETDVFSDWKEWILTDGNNFLRAVRSVGGDPRTDTQDLGATFFLTNGWRIRPAEANHRLQLNGNIGTDPPGNAVVVPTIGQFQVVVENTISNLIDTVDLTGTIGTTEEIVDAVWDENAADHLLVGSTGEKLSSGNVTATVNVNAVAIAVWEEAANAHENVGTMGDFQSNTSVFADAIWTNNTFSASANSAGFTLKLIEKILRGKTVTDPNTGVMTVFDENSSTILFTTTIFEDVAELIAYRDQGVDVRNRLE